VAFLRVIRDKRGYETSYLMHWFQEGGRQRSKVLYAFRGPGGARVGRQPLESATLRQLESTYPGILFDWKAVFAERQVIEAGPEPRRKRPRREEGREEDGAPHAVTSPEAEASPPVPPVPRVPIQGIPSTILGETSQEKRAFLAEVYPLARERVERRTTDETRKLALLTLVERLNPEMWGADADGADEADRLSQAAEALERLSRVLIRRRRRGGRGERPPAETAPPTEG
jgi:hypothetical protein